MDNDFTDNDLPVKRRRGRPPKLGGKLFQTREMLLGVSMEALTERGFSGVGIDAILRRADVPKGSFYNYFRSKEALGTELIARFAAYVSLKMERCLADETLTPLRRLRVFTEDVRHGMVRENFRYGCLVGKLAQEVNSLPGSFREQLAEVFAQWEERFAKGLKAARDAGEISPALDCERAAAFFWFGWEGALQRANLILRPEPIDIFLEEYFAGLVR